MSGIKVLHSPRDLIVFTFYDIRISRSESMIYMYCMTSSDSVITTEIVRIKLKKGNIKTCAEKYNNLLYLTYY